MKRFLSFFLLANVVPIAGAAEQTVKLHWLDQKPHFAQGVSWGVPWPRGVVPKNTSFQVADSQGNPVEVQSWPLAYWPDGSLKWTGHAITTAEAQDGSLTLSIGDAAAPSSPLKTSETQDYIEICNGMIVCRLSKHGSSLVDSIAIGDRVVAKDGQLVCLLEDRSQEETQHIVREQDFVSEISSAKLEQSGPVRAVVKFEGKHQSAASGRVWLPFVVRLYFYAGSDAIKMVHTIVFDGDQEEDFIKGLGVRFTVPMVEQVQNRHVRFSGEGNGLWSEPVQPLVGRQGRFVRNLNGGGDVYRDQLEGRRVPNREDVNARGQDLMKMWAVWDDFKLVQPNADGFTIMKRTNPQSAWIAAGAGKRASGLVFAGDVGGGLAVGLKNFWESYPASLEVRKASSDATKLIVWMWSPDAPAMDMRHYDTKGHGLEEVYEDVHPGYSTATGVARTSELMLYPTAGVPTREQTVAMAQATAKPPVLVCAPKYYHDVQAFGIWGLKDRSTPVKRAIEGQLDKVLDYYLTQPEQRHWYGFWDFGDVMHSYDAARHVWRYDLGGMAWDNSELGTDMWLWYSFLRSGRADVFRMAEAMTRHTGEVDCYHLGRFAGLGSRHNVRHWGGGAKEARISQAAYRRFYYYLTTDERTGDVMREMLNADQKMLEFDPMRYAQPITEAEKKIAPTRVRVGPDWLAFVSNWMTEWERTGDTKWRDKILAGVDCMSKMPYGMRTGRNLVMGYDPATGKLYQLNDQLGTYNLATIMGGAEVAMELSLFLDDERWQKLWLQYCRLYSAPRDVMIRDRTTGNEGMDANYVRDGRLAGFVYSRTHNEAFLHRAINALLLYARGSRWGERPIRHVEGPDVLNPVDDAPTSTNAASQDGLEAISMLGTVGDHLPAEFPTEMPGRGGRFRGGRDGQ